MPCITSLSLSLFLSYFLLHLLLCLPSVWETTNSAVRIVTPSSRSQLNRIHWHINTAPQSLCVNSSHTFHCHFWRPHCTPLTQDLTYPQNLSIHKWMAQLHNSSPPKLRKAIGPLDILWCLGNYHLTLHLISLRSHSCKLKFTLHCMHDSPSTASCPFKHKANQMPPSQRSAHTAVQSCSSCCHAPCRASAAS